VTFEWTAYLELAEQLLAGDEASKRSAISRAYYAAYNKARAYLQQNGVTVSTTGDSHASVWDSLGRRGTTYVRLRAASQGKALRVRRNQADYELVYRGRISDEAQSALNQAKSVIEEVTRSGER
jgi:hypothetical protein